MENEQESRDLNRWFDGELPEEEMDRVGEGLLGHSERSQSIEFLRSIRESIRARKPLSAGSSFTDRVMKAVIPSGFESPWLVVEPFVKGLAAAASILLVVSISLWFLFAKAPRDTFAAGPIRPSALELEMLLDRNAGSSPSEESLK